ncbi:unnamed protein product (macronuclear) [Paramecium tetraurelia]|uniref:Uncharacterized protein n=1 Tax=Paramecium tetraurelia TaxID=5888 RepID=A0DJ83_PARTE|nr:uncharacterized protein GSPATT00017457001 [Paramecium tetraurelia]CAK83100.1 unnamed protein product [Paramecium tetraurelia]|eukprot:XP_001450497.1 hypothetical protein (macronuclear) [Paramecium tetraurelia strain d4-2]
MTQETLRQLARQLNKNKFLIAKPATDVFQCVQAFILLVKGVKIQDWLLAQLLMSCSLPQMVETIIEKKIDYANVILCKKLYQLIPQQQNSLGKLIYQLISQSLNFLEGERGKSQRSKSTILRHEPSVLWQQHQQNNFILKQECYQSKVKIIKNQKIKEEDEKKFELLKEKMKKINKNSYFISPRKIQFEQQEKIILSNNNSERQLIHNKQMRSLRSFRSSFYD